jgi:hypothetical protein
MRFDIRGMQASGMSTADINRNISQATQRLEERRAAMGPRSMGGSVRGVTANNMKRSSGRKSAR